MSLFSFFGGNIYTVMYLIFRVYTILLVICLKEKKIDNKRNGYEFTTIVFGR